MKGICTNCGKEFETLTGRRTCSTVCHIARQRQAVEEMRGKSGEIYLRWHARMMSGIVAGKERRSKKKGGEK